MAGRDNIPANSSRLRSHSHLEHRRHSHGHRLQLLEDQAREIQTLLHDNQRLAATHVALKQEVVATEQDLRLLSATAASVKAEREAQVREFYDRSCKLEAEARSIEAIPAELERVRADIEELRAERKELLEKVSDIDGIKRTHLELQQLPVLNAEIETLRREIKRGRAAVEYERKMQAKNLKLNEAMEKHMATLSSEIQKLHSELADAEKRAMASAAATVSAANPNHVYGYPAHPGGLEPVYGGNSASGPYAVQQGSVDANLQYGVGAGHHGAHVVHGQQRHS